MQPRRLPRGCAFEYASINFSYRCSRVGTENCFPREIACVSSGQERGSTEVRICDTMASYFFDGFSYLFCVYIYIYVCFWFRNRLIVIFFLWERILHVWGRKGVFSVTRVACFWPFLSRDVIKRSLKLIDEIKLLIVELMKYLFASLSLSEGKFKYTLNILFFFYKQFLVLLYSRYLFSSFPFDCTIIREPVNYTKPRL